MNTKQIMTIAMIRRFLDERMSAGEIDYFDVMEKVIVPSDESDYVDYDGIVIVTSKKQKEVIEKIFADVFTVKIVVIVL